MPKRRKTPAAQGDPPAAIRAVAQKRPKTVPIQEINYQKLAEEIIKQQRATQSSANATLPVPPAPNDGNNDTVLAQPIHQTIAQLSTAPVQETALSPNALGNATQTPGTTSLGPSTSTAHNSSTDVTVSSLVSQIFGTHEGGIQFHASIKSPTDANTSDFFDNLSQQACHLLSAALTNNTKTSYKRSWDLLLQFNPTVTSLPISPSVTSNFIAHLFTIGYSPSSISSHISAISYVHKILGLSDPSESFLVRKIVQGCHHSAPNKDTRLPITGPILHNLVNGLHKSVQNLHYRILLKAIFLLAFNAFLRLGELVVKSKASSNTVIQREDVSFEFSNKSKSPSALVLLLRNFKTNKTKDLFQIHLKALGDSDMCPVLALYLYLEAFSHQSGPLFQFMGGDPVSYAFVSRHLHNTVLFIGLNPALYKGHSFRIGAATQAAQQGFSENCIQKMGRWNSDAVRRYIRLQSFVI